MQFERRNKRPRFGCAHLVCLLLPLLWLQACGGASPEPVAAPGNRARSASEHGPFLWQVERDGAISHVFGTIHVGVRLSELAPVIGERLDQSHTLVVEADTDDEGSAELLGSMFLEPGQSLRAMLGDAPWQVLVTHLGHVFPAAMLDRMPPWMAQTMLSLDDTMLAANAASLDSELVARARQKGKRLAFLETAKEQLELLSEIIDIDDLRSTLDDVPGARRELRVLLRAYRSGNLAALHGLTLDPDDLAKNPDEFERLLFARNRAWMTALEPMLARGGVFVAVGAAHFVGDDGLLALLLRAGFRVTRVSAGAFARSRAPAFQHAVW